jgi:hypothetical protein
MQSVLDFLPKHGGSKRFFNNLTQPGPSICAAQFRAVRNIVEDGHGEGGRKVKHHPDASPELSEICLRVIDIGFIDVNCSGVAGPKSQIRETIHAFKECCLPTASRAEDGKYLLGPNIQVDIPQGVNGVVKKTEIVDDDLTFLRHEIPFPRQK